jgi:hypothetical protein
MVGSAAAGLGLSPACGGARWVGGQTLVGDHE